MLLFHDDAIHLKPLTGHPGSTGTGRVTPAWLWKTGEETGRVLKLTDILWLKLLKSAISAHKQ